MIDCPGKFKSKLASHLRKISPQELFMSRLDPFDVTPLMLL
jgi:hypothetical protein